MPFAYFCLFGFPSSTRNGFDEEDASFWSYVPHWLQLFWDEQIDFSSQNEKYLTRQMANLHKCLPSTYIQYTSLTNTSFHISQRIIKTMQVFIVKLVKVFHHFTYFLYNHRHLFVLSTSSLGDQTDDNMNRWRWSYQKHVKWWKT